MVKRDFAFAIEVPDWAGEEAEDGRVGAAEGVVDVVDGGDVGFAAGEGAGNAEEADDVGGVAVEELAADCSLVSAVVSTVRYLSSCHLQPNLKKMGGTKKKEQEKGQRGMEQYIPRIRPIDPHPIDLSRIVPQVLDVAQHMALPVLADEVAEVGAQPHVRDRGFVVAPSLDGEALEEDVALAV